MDGVMTGRPTVLYFAPDNASLVVRLALEELGEPYETRLVDRRTEAHKGEAFRRLNPHVLIPACVIDGAPMFETGAILLRLAERAGRLMPAPTEPGRGRALSWFLFVANTLHADLRLVFYPARLGGAGAAAVGLTRERVRESFARLETAIAESGGPYLMGDTLSLVDLYAATCLRWSQLYPVDDPIWPNPAPVVEAMPALAAMARAVQARPAAIRAGAAEGIPAPLILPARPPDGSAGAAR
jgi:glutathione S-transferase